MPRHRLHNTALPVILTLVLATLPGCGDRPLPVSASRLWERSYLYVAPADLNGDSTDELGCLENDYVIDCVSQDMMRAVGGTVYLDTGTLNPGTSIAGGSKESGIWYTYTRHDSLLLFSTLAGKDLFVAQGHGSLPPAGWDGYAASVATIDLNRDGRLEAVVAVASGVDARPRGIYALDYATGQSLWSYPTGPAVLATSFVDVDGDSSIELLFGSGAHGNGGSANGRSDDSSYVFLLSDSGRPRWVTPIGRHSSQAHAAPWMSRRSNQPQVVVYEIGNEVGGRSCDSVFLLDAGTGAKLLGRQFGRFTSCGAVSQDAAGNSMLALGGSDSILRILDESLAVVRTCPTPGAIRDICSGNFSGAGQREWAVVTNDGLLLLYDAALAPRAKAVCATTGVGVSLYAVKCATKDRLLVQDSNDDENRWLLYDFTPIPPMGRRVPLTIVIAISAGLLLLFLTAVVALRHRLSDEVRTVIRGLTGHAGVVEMDHRGKLLRANAKGRELLQLAEATEKSPLSGRLTPLRFTGRPGAEPRELPLSFPAGQTVLARLTPVKSGLLLTLEDISAVEYMKRITSWAPAAQKLAHDIKNPLTAMALNLQRLDKFRTPDTERYYANLSYEIDRLKKMADGFMRLSKLEPPKLAPGSINELVRTCVARFESAKPPGITIIADLTEGLPSVAIDADQMAAACTNIVENAVSAMGESGVLTIRSHLAESRKLITVSVCDTGKGIPERYIDKVFEPFFTLKPGGTGLGMALTKRIIEDHKGTITIQSKEGAGTTVTITLPVAQSNGR